MATAATARADAAEKRVAQLVVARKELDASMRARQEEESRYWASLLATTEAARDAAEERQQCLDGKLRELRMAEESWVAQLTSVDAARTEAEAGRQRAEARVAQLKARLSQCADDAQRWQDRLHACERLLEGAREEALTDATLIIERAQEDARKDREALVQHARLERAASVATAHSATAEVAALRGRVRDLEEALRRSQEEADAMAAEAKALRLASHG